MRKSFVQVFHDHARVVEHKVAVDERGRGVVRIEVEQVLGIFPGCDIDDFDVYGFFRDHYSRAMTPRVIGRREQSHGCAAARHSVPSTQAFSDDRGPDEDGAAQRTSFQYSAFSMYAIPVNMRRNRTTQIPRLCRSSCAGSLTYCRKFTVSRANSSNCSGVSAPTTPGSNALNSVVTTGLPSSP